MKFANNVVWFSSDRPLCELQTDGTVVFVDDITTEELRWAVTALMHELEIRRQRSLENLQLSKEHSMDHIVKIHNKTFDPIKINPKVGETIIWKNEDSVVHTVTANNGREFDYQLQPGASFAHKFNFLGTFEYHCEFHPEMTGIVEVTNN